MALISKQQINDAVDLKWEDVPVPEWGEGAEVRMMELDASQRGYIEAGSVVANDTGVSARVDSLKVYREKLVMLSMVDENFNRVFSNKELPLLSKKSGAVIERLAAVVQRLSGMGRFAAKDAEENSVAAPSDSSDSD